MEYFAKAYDVAVIGAGHAGIEAGLAAARLGCSTAVFTINMDWVGNMPCNPSIGGSSKGHLVREVDALGGEMGKVIDKTYIQTKMLNTGKGPAVYSLRAQADKQAYQSEMKHRLENTPNLKIKQAEIVDIRMENAAGQVMTVRGESLGGGKVRIVRINGVEVDFTGEYNALIVVQKDKPGVVAHISKILSDRGVNIAFMRLFREEKGHTAYTIVESDERLPEGVDQLLLANPNINDVMVVQP